MPSTSREEAFVTDTSIDRDLDPGTATVVEGRAEAAAQAPASRRPGRLTLAAIALAVAVLVGGLWALASRPFTNPALAGTRSVTADELESVYGAHIDRVALLASGGLIELRFRVIDKDKAVALFGEVDDMPKLAIEHSDVVLESGHGMRHKLSLVNGGSYFILYPNPANVVTKGTEVSFLMNGYRIPHITVQK
jgi:hypothetical protein